MWDELVRVLGNELAWFVGGMAMMGVLWVILQGLIRLSAWYLRYEQWRSSKGR